MCNETVISYVWKKLKPVAINAPLHLPYAFCAEAFCIQAMYFGHVWPCDVNRMNSRHIFIIMVFLSKYSRFDQRCWPPILHYTLRHVPSPWTLPVSGHHIMPETLKDHVTSELPTHMHWLWDTRILRYSHAHAAHLLYLTHWKVLLLFS